jgi:predicted Zn-dependent peptidase
MVGWHVPESAHPDYYPLQVLRTILFEGESSRMYRRLVDRDQLAITVNGAHPLSFDPTLFEITVQPRTGVSPSAVETAVFEEIDRLKTEFVSNEEIEKARNILVANFYRSMKTIDGKANAIGRYDVFFGDHRRLFDAAEDYSRVTKDDLQRVVRTYFTESNRTVATLVPERPQ